MTDVSGDVPRPLAKREREEAAKRARETAKSPPKE